MVFPPDMTPVYHDVLTIFHVTGFGVIERAIRSMIYARSLLSNVSVYKIYRYPLEEKQMSDLFI